MYLPPNWALVEQLLEEYPQDVQWIFVSHGVKAALLTYALQAGASLDTVERAVSVLHQPSDSSPHDDHFHVRIYCPASAGAGCVDVGPVWPWAQGRAPAAPSIADADLAKMALEGL